jgi:hypothetical protein
MSDKVAMDVKLELGPQTESVDVEGAAPLLETGTVGFGVDRVKIAAMPPDGRNFIPLIALSPGVALPGGGFLLPRINGSRPRTNEYLYDGISVLQPEPGQVAFYPVLDGIVEFRLNVNAYSPEYGRSNGGTVMVASPSRARGIHGTSNSSFGCTSKSHDILGCHARADIRSEELGSHARGGALLQGAACGYPNRRFEEEGHCCR